MLKVSPAHHARLASRTGAVPPAAGSPLLLIALALAGGLMWGGATSGLQTVLSGPWSALANAASPWVLPAFAVGALARRPAPAVLAGLAACLGEVGGYYLLSALRGFGVGTGEIVLWSATALLGGPVFALAGWAWRRAPAGRWRWPALGAAMPTGVLLVEGGFVHAWILGYTGSAVLFCTLGVIAGLVLGAGAAARGRPGTSGARGGVAATAAWLGVVVPAGLLGEVLLSTFSL